MTYSDFSCEINIKKNPLNLNVDDYLEVALRNNPKRRFLFVSKTLGKHIPVNPQKVDELGKTLADAYKMKYKNYLNQRQMVIGFAETATCLAHSFFNYLESSEFFIHTTREEVKGAEKLEFLEEHSHATEQNLYIDNLSDVESIDSIILVDDEITTAKTCINMIRKMQEVYNVKRYVIASILNWIDEERKAEIKRQAEEMGCEISFVYLFNGSFNFKMNNDISLDDNIEVIDSDANNQEFEINNIKLDFSKYISDKKYVKYTGRFGISRAEQNELLDIIKEQGIKLKPKYSDKDILALGIEEFMYIPMMLSKTINGQVYYHSITRSPIIPRDVEGYPIRKKYKLESFYNENTNFIYNLNAHEYKECFLFMEIDKDIDKVHEFIEILKSVGIKRVNIVRC